jgi:hypothetical protein
MFVFSYLIDYLGGSGNLEKKSSFRFITFEAFKVKCIGGGKKYNFIIRNKIKTGSRPSHITR